MEKNGIHKNQNGKNGIWGKNKMVIGKKNNRFYRALEQEQRQTFLAL